LGAEPFHGWGPHGGAANRHSVRPQIKNFGTGPGSAAGLDAATPVGWVSDIGRRERQGLASVLWVECCTEAFRDRSRCDVLRMHISH